jgi:hypothetical protein
MGRDSAGKDAAMREVFMVIVLAVVASIASNAGESEASRIKRDMREQQEIVDANCRSTESIVTASDPH